MEPLTERSKIKHLPEDLRGIAEAMLREKFGHKTRCEECSKPYDEEHSAPYNQFTQIDWNMCRDCYDECQELSAKEHATYTYSVDKSFTQSTSVTGSLTEESLLKAIKYMKDSAVEESLLGYSPAYIIKDGELPQPYIYDKPYVIMNPRNYSKSEY